MEWSLFKSKRNFGKSRQDLRVLIGSRCNGVSGSRCWFWNLPIWCAGGKEFFMLNLSSFMVNLLRRSTHVFLHIERRIQWQTNRTEKNHNDFEKKKSYALLLSLTIYTFSLRVNIAVLLSSGVYQIYFENLSYIKRFVHFIILGQSM